MKTMMRICDQSEAADRRDNFWRKEGPCIRAALHL